MECSLRWNTELIKSLSPSADKWINSLGSMHTGDYDAAMKRREAWTQAAMRMDLEPTMLRREARPRRTHSVRFHGSETSRTGTFTDAEE